MDKQDVKIHSDAYERYWKIKTKLVSADKIVRHDIIVTRYVADYKGERGKEWNYKTDKVLMITKNKIRIHASIATYVDKYDECGNLKKYLIMK